jgi:hypothetical protein
MLCEQLVQKATSLSWEKAYLKQVGCNMHVVEVDFMVGECIFHGGSNL